MRLIRRYRALYDYLNRDLYDYSDVKEICMINQALERSVRYFDKIIVIDYVFFYGQIKKN